MSKNTVNRTPWATRVVAVAAVAGAATVGVIVGASPASAVAAPTITAVSPHLVAALTANQVITVSGTNFSESTITAVAVAGCTSPSYIVASPTSLLVKTDNTCAVGANKAVTISYGSSSTVASNPTATGGAQALSFVAAPTILTASATARPMMTVASDGAAYADQVTSASTKGAVAVKVLAGATHFVNTTATALKASFDGVAMTSVTMHTGGDYFTGVLGAHDADATPTLTITSGGVSKTFNYGAGGAGATDQTFDFTYAGTTIVASPASGPISGGNALKISGVGFTASTTATVGGASCPITAHTATSLTCTVPAVSSAGPVTVATSTSGLASVISSGSTYTYLGA